MAHEIFVADAAHFIGKPGAKRLINQAWKQGTITLRGVRPGESEPVEIPFNEGGRVDCKKSRIVIGRLCTTYLSVTMKWPDVERLAQADVEWLLREAALVAANTPVIEAPPNQPSQNVPSVTETLAPQANVEQVTQEAVTTASKPKQEDEVAAALFQEWPNVRPRGMKVKDLLIVLHDSDRHPDLGTFGMSTLERAIRKAKKMGWSYQTDRQLPSDGD